MGKLSLTLAALLIGGTAFAGGFRVHYNARAGDRDVAVQAESPLKPAGRVMEMFPGAVVSSVSQIK